MKKIIIFIFILLISILSITIYFSYQKKSMNDYFIIKQNKSYVYKENEELSFELYSYKNNSLITFKDENEYFICYEDNIINLVDVSINEYYQNDIYLIKIKSKMPEVFKNGIIIKDLILKINNDKFSFMANMGSLSILDPTNYELLSINDLYASYSYINNNLMLVGINISLTNEYRTLSDFKIGNFTSSLLSLALKDSLYDNEIEIKKILPSYDPTEIENKTIDLKSNTYFIPITYIEYNVIKEGYITLKLDDKLYYLDTFSFITNDLIFNDYKNLSRSANISYDRNR